jgi:hypothetical protein
LLLFVCSHVPDDPLLFVCQCVRASAIRASIGVRYSRKSG